MAIEFSEQNGSVRLQGELTIYHAAEIKQPLIAKLETTRDLEIDLSGIVEIDTAGVQILILLKKEADRLGKTLRLAAHSQAVVEMMNLYNLAGFFGDPLIITARQRKGE